MRAAYADPPYLGCGKSHYGKLHEQAGDYDDPMTHKRLIERLTDEYEAWALSCHEPSLHILRPWCPEDCRTGAWVKPFAAFRPGVTHAYTWEPVIFRFSRKRTKQQDTWRDFIEAEPPAVKEPITMRRGFTGAKPEKFCFWLFEALNLQDGDEFHDLFPGSGAVTAAYEKWRNRANSEQFKLEVA